MDHYIGKMLDSRYEILEVIGTGGMAVVYKAKCHRLNRLVAIKILKSDLALDAEFRRRFHDESKAVAMLSHPNIVSVYDVSRGGDTEYIVMELIDGITLKQYMERRGQLNWRESLHFMTQIMKGLSHAHSRGIVHRDIKPQNIMVLRDGSVKVADFGIACLENSSQTLTQEALGSVHYISPEQARGDRPDARSDIYSSGVVFYEMLSGRLPFEGDSAVAVAIQHLSSIPLPPREINSDIPEALEKICMKAMAPDIEKRYQSADNMVADLEIFRKNPDAEFDYSIADLQQDTVDEPTRYIPTSSGHHAPPREERYESPARSGGKKRIALIAGGIVGAVLLLVLLFKFIFSSFGAAVPEEYEVPSVLDMTVSEAQELKGVKDIFEIKIAGNKASKEFENGKIMEQDPEAGKMKKGDLLIRVYVSSGEDIRTMPDLVNKEIRVAQEELNNLHLNLVLAPPALVFSDTYNADYVISSVPAKGEPLKEGDSITLTVSKGPEQLPVTVPSFLGMQVEVAKKQITELGLVCEVITAVGNETAGQVLSQTVPATSTVAPGTKIELTVSEGAPTSSVTENYSLPTDRDIVHVMIELNGTVVFDNDVNTSLGSISQTFTGSGTGKVNVYFDDVLSITEEITFN